MLTDEQRQALFLEMHRSIERAATEAAAQLPSRHPPALAYPPNHGFTDGEAFALRQLPAVPELQSALRKVIASAASRPLFDLLCLLDGVSDPEHYAPLWLGARIEPVCEEAEDTEDDGADFLHDQFYETYWQWRDKRPDPGWRLDNYGSAGSRLASSTSRGDEPTPAGDG